MDWYHYMMAVAVGVLTGAAELVARYRDDPAKALITTPALVYIAINGMAAGAALYFIEIFAWTFGVDNSNRQALLLVQILVAGLGTMALFRSALLTVRVGDSDVGIGPSGLLQVILGAADRAVDRARAKPRAEAIGQIMSGVDFDKAKTSLPLFCFNLMQNVTTDEQSEFGKFLAKLDQSDMDKETKALNLGLALLNLVGAEVLAAAVQSLRSQVGGNPGTPPTRSATAATP